MIKIEQRLVQVISDWLIIMHSWLAFSTFLLLPLFHGTSSQIISPSVPPVVVQSEASQIETEDSSPCSKAVS